MLAFLLAASSVALQSAAAVRPSVAVAPAVGIVQPARTGALTEPELASLRGEHNFVEVPNWLTAAHVDGLVQDLRGLLDTGAACTRAMDAHGSLQWFAFGPGSVGASADPIALDAGGNPAARAAYCERMDELKRSIEDGVGTYFDPDWTELQYAYYPNGGYYHKHVDSGQPHTHPNLPAGELIKRSCSFVLYLNRGWTEADAGHLRVYESRALDAAHRDVAPRAGTIVVFKSDEVMHEVMRSHAERMCIVGWFNSLQTREARLAGEQGSDTWAV